MKTIILAGGWGTRLEGEDERIPKPMVPIGNRPILWHIMKIYSHYGFNEFVICLGVKADVIKNYFYNYEVINSNFTLDISTEKYWNQIFESQHIIQDNQFLFLAGAELPWRLWSSSM